MLRIIFLLLLIIGLQPTTAQTITGQLKAHAGQQLTLTGFDNYKTEELAKTIVDSLGFFSLNYSKNYQGMAFLKTQDNSSLLLLLDQPLLKINGTHLVEYDSLMFNHSENKLFFNYAKAQGQRSNALSAWKFLDNLYHKPGVLFNQKSVKKQIIKEQKRIAKEDADFVKNLKQDSYLAWFIPKRTLIQETSTIIKTATQRIPEAIAQFRNTNFNNPNWKTSGILKEFIDGHYFLLENMGQSLDSVYAQMNLSTDYLIDTLKQNNSVLNNVSKELFKLFEKRSLFKVAAHLSEKLLSSEDCACFIEQDLQKKMQKYVTLKVGNIAPDIQLTATKKLSHLKQNVLLVFGSSTCPTCKKDALQLMEYYIKWKENKTPLEVVYISLDTDQATFNTAFKDVPWPSYCDFKGWDMQAVKDYYVNAIPTYLLLDKDQTILLHPKSIAHVNAWIMHRLK